jgi:hypothetical protein
MGRRILTVGTPLGSLGGPYANYPIENLVTPGWVIVDCQFCDEKMVCREGNERPKEEGDTVTLCCRNCLENNKHDPELN